MRRTLLVAAADPPVRRLITMTVERVRGLEVIEAADWRTATALARRRPPLVALLDAEMPGVTGVCRRIRAADGGEDAALVLIGSAPAWRGEHRAVRAGADHYVTRPFSPLALLRLVDAAAHPLGI